jgi:hypothetical protein
VFFSVQGTTKEEFAVNSVHVEMQHRHLYIVHHATKAANAIVVY